MAGLRKAIEEGKLESRNRVLPTSGATRSHLLER